jgi:hypothetical protein
MAFITLAMSSAVTSCGCFLLIILPKQNIIRTNYNLRHTIIPLSALQTYSHELWTLLVNVEILTILCTDNPIASSNNKCIVDENWRFRRTEVHVALRCVDKVRVN